MNERFIDEVAELLLQKHPEDLDKICVVFPNRRAALFLKQSLATKAQKIIWSPEVFATQDFVADICDLKIADNLQLLFMFYEVYKELKGNEADSFEIFSQWANGLLHDFNEIDLYAENPKALFEYLSETKAIELWAQNFSELTTLQKSYLEFWRMLEKLYHTFREKLKSQSLAYSGMAFRAISVLEETQFINPNRKHIYFAGFNALTKAESDFMKKLCKAGLATMVWDADHHYFDDNVHEAGYFLRRVDREWKNISKISPKNLLKEKSRNIEVIGVAKNIAQVQTAGRIIDKLLSEGENLSDIALVLADETLLLPQLEFLPESVKKVNITMGYPLQATSAAVLLKQIIKLHVESIKLSERLNQGEAMLYSSSFLRLLKHPLIAILFESADKSIEIEQALFPDKKNRTVYIEASKIADVLQSFGVDDAFIAIFQKEAKSVHGLIEILATFFDILLQKQISKTVFADELGIESIFQLKKVIVQTNDLISLYKIELSLIGLEKLLSSQIAGQSIAFYGEPLEGLQIMGMLETRCLDFKHIIMLSVNEDILPKGRSNNSFIPIDIKRQFGLPIFSDSDAVFSYHFYRLLQRSENAYLLYNTEADEMGKGEASRFILQLQHELKNNNTKITKSIAPSDVISDDTSKEIIVKKSDEIMTVLQQNAKHGFSPSALNTYLACSLRYYFKYVLRIKVTEEFDESVGMDEMGTAVHKVLEDIYKEFKGGFIDRNYIKTQNQKLQSILKPVLINTIGGKSIDFGRNKLYALVAEKITHTFLSAEVENKNIDDTQLISVESNLNTDFNLINSDLEIKLAGSADRIDKNGELVRVIDYKTGTVDAKKLKYTDLGSFLEGDKDTAKVLQLLMYAYIYLKENPNAMAVQPSIFGLRYKGNTEMPLNFMNAFQINRNDLAEIETVLQTIISDIFNKDLPFVQTEDKSKCEYCDFISVCNRF